MVPDSGTGDLAGLAGTLDIKIVDHERVWGVRDTPIEIAAVYEVAGDLIERVWFFPSD